jgi:hypothetical protein
MMHVAPFLLHNHSVQRSLSATHRLLCMDQQQFVDFVSQRGLAIIATRGAGDGPQAAQVSITTTGRGELVFDTSRSFRKVPPFVRLWPGSATHRLGR